MKKKSILSEIWGVLYPLLIYFVITTVVSSAFSMFWSFSMVQFFIQDGVVNMPAYMAALQERITENTMLILLAAMVVSFPILFFLFRRDQKRKAEAFETPGAVYYIPVILAGFTACLGLNYLISLLKIPELFPAYQEVSKQIYGGNFVIQLFSAVVGAAVIEELLFRGIMYGRLKSFLNKKAAILVSALLFGLYHMNMVQGIYAFLIGVLLAFTYEKFKTIAAPILLHGAANLFSVFMVQTGVLDFTEGSVLWSVVFSVVPLAILAVCVWVIQNKVSVVREQEEQVLNGNE